MHQKVAVLVHLHYPHRNEILLISVNYCKFRKLYCIFIFYRNPLSQTKYELATIRRRCISGMSKDISRNSSH
nr:MAG TPA: hypothetical protein [Caudoviricetes sp.]